MQMETRDLRVAVLEYGLDPGRTETAFTQAFGPFWRRLYHHDDPVASASEGASRAVDDPNALGAAYLHKLLRGPRRGKVAAARPLPAREVELMPTYQQVPVQPLGSIALDLAYLDESDVTAMDEAEITSLARWMDDLLVQMRVPSSIEEGAWLDLTTSEKELVDLMIDRLNEAEAHLGKPVKVPKLYLRLGNVLDKVDLSREYDVPTAMAVYTMEIREPQGSERILALFERAIRLDPEDPEAWRNKARALEDEGRDEEAAICYQRLMELGSIPEDDPRWEARKLISLGRYDEAFTHCAQAVELDPLDREAWYNMGMVLHNMGRLEEALDCYTNAIEINPRFARAWFAKGRAQESMGRSREARRSYEQAFRAGYGDEWPGPEPYPDMGG
jgi:tetratricopeptide (TPR) repeat protein